MTDGSTTTDNPSSPPVTTGSTYKTADKASAATDLTSKTAYKASADTDLTSKAADSTLRVLRIVDGTSVDGPGLRTSIYLAGCTHNCPGCHNPQSHDPAGGEEMTVGELMQHIDNEGYNVTFSGGDPLLQATALIPLLQLVKQRGYNVWLYTGYTWEQIETSPTLSQVLELIDVLVDGRFEHTLKDESLLFRGSSNQRLIDVPATLRTRSVTLWQRQVR